MAEIYEWNAGEPIQSSPDFKWQVGKPYIVLEVLPSGDVVVTVSVVDGVFEVLPITFHVVELFAVLFEMKPRDRIFSPKLRDRIKKVKSKERIFDVKY